MASMTPIDGNKETPQIHAPSTNSSHQRHCLGKLLHYLLSKPSLMTLLQSNMPNVLKHVKKLLKIYLQSLIHPHIQMTMMVNPLCLSHQRKGKNGLTFLMCHQKKRMIIFGVLVGACGVLVWCKMAHHLAKVGDEMGMVLVGC